MTIIPHVSRIFNRNILHIKDNYQKAIIRVLECILRLHPNDPIGRRIAIVFLMAVGIPPSQFAACLQYSERQCHNIYNKFKEIGFKAVVNTPAGGRRANDKAETTITREVFQAIREGETVPSDSELADQISEQHNISIGSRTVRRIRTKHGMVYLKINNKDEKSEVDEETDVNNTHKVRTEYAGLWIVLPLILNSHWFKSATKILSFKHNHIVTIENLLVTLVCSYLLGIKRIYHLNDETDAGFALITGRKRILEQSTVWKLIADIPKRAFCWFYEHTSDKLIKSSSNLIGLDTHSVARWTQIARLPKLWVSTRGKAMKATGLCFLYDIKAHKFIGLRIVEDKISTFLLSVVKQLNRIKDKAYTILVDNEGCSGHNLEVLSEDKRATILTTPMKSKPNRKQWLLIPKADWSPFKKLWDSKKPAIDQRNLEIAQTKTNMTNCNAPVKTAVIRENKRTKGVKYYAIVSSNINRNAISMAEDYALHWRQETAYRYSKHDIGLDAIPKTYKIKRIRNEKKIIIKRVIERNSPRTLFITWLKAMVYNIFQEFSEAIGKKLSAGTIIRRYIRIPGTIVHEDGLIKINVDYFKEQEALENLVANINQGSTVRIPWLGNVSLKISLTSHEEADVKTCQLLKSVMARDMKAS